MCVCFAGTFIVWLGIVLTPDGGHGSRIVDSDLFFLIFEG